MMHEHDSQQDEAMRRLFAATIPDLADDGFSITVMKRIRAGMWRRRLLLASAALFGFVIAAPAIAQVLIGLSQALAGVARSPGEASGTADLTLLLALLPVREGILEASGGLMNLGDLLRSAAWLREYWVFAIAALMALLSVAIPRLLER